MYVKLEESDSWVLHTSMWTADLRLPVEDRIPTFHSVGIIRQDGDSGLYSVVWKSVEGVEDDLVDDGTGKAQYTLMWRGNWSGCVKEIGEIVGDLERDAIRLPNRDGRMSDIA